MKKLVLLLVLPILVNAQRININGAVATNPVTSGIVADFDFTSQSSVITAGNKSVSITDAIGSVVSSQATQSLAPIYSASGGPGNCGYASFTGTQTLTGALLTSSTSFTVIIIKQASASQTSAGQYGAFANGASAAAYGWTDNYSGTNCGALFTNVSDLSSPNLVAYPLMWEMVAFSHSPTHTKNYNTNGIWALPGSNPTANPLTPTTSHTIGNSFATNLFLGGIARIIVYNRMLTDAEMQSVFNWGHVRYNLPYPVSYISGGDSISSLPGGGTIAYPILTYQNYYPTKYINYYQTAVPGLTSQNVLDSIHLVTDRIKQGVINIYTVMIGHNDVGVISLATTKSNLAAIGDAVRAAGGKCIFATLLYSTSYTNATCDTYNTYIKTLVSLGHADAIWDANQCPNLIDPTNTTYYVDGVHPTLLGEQLLAANLEPIFVNFLP